MGEGGLSLISEFSRKCLAGGIVGTLAARFQRLRRTHNTATRPFFPRATIPPATQARECEVKNRA